MTLTDEVFGLSREVEEKRGCNTTTTITITTIAALLFGGGSNFGGMTIIDRLHFRYKCIYLYIYIYNLYREGGNGKKREIAKIIENKKIIIFHSIIYYIL